MGVAGRWMARKPSQVPRSSMSRGDRARPMEKAGSSTLCESKILFGGWTVDIIHRLVTNPSLGEGRIEKVSGNFVTVAFSDCEKSYCFDVAFEKGTIVFSDSETQAYFETFFTKKREDAERAKMEAERLAAERKDAQDRLQLRIEQAIDGSSGLLVGDFRFEDEEIEELKKQFVSKYNAIDSVSALTTQDVQRFLVVATNRLRDLKKDWSDFYEVLAGFFDDISLFSISSRRNQLNEKIADVFAENDRIIFRTKSEKRAFEQTLLYQAMAPKDSMTNFIRLAWNLYIDEDILESCYDSSDLEFCGYIVKALASRFGCIDDEDSVDIKFSGVSYGIRAGLKYGCLQNPEKTAILLDKILRFIHRADHFSEEITESHLGLLVTDVVAEQKRIIKKERRLGQRTSKKGYVHSVEQAKPEFACEEDGNTEPRLLLAFPKVIILDVVRDYRWAVFRIEKRNSDGSREPICESPLQNFRSNETCCSLASYEWDVTDFLTRLDNDFDIEVVMQTNKGIAYETSKSLCRKFLVFKDGHPVKGTCRPGTFLLAAPKNFDPESHLKFLSRKYKKVRNGLFYIDAEECDSIVYEGETMFFNSGSKSASVRFDDSKMSLVENAVYLEGEESVPIYRNVSDIFIEPDINPSAVRIIHERIKEDGSFEKSETILSDVPMDGGRHRYSAVENGLGSFGLHVIKIIKLSSAGPQSLLTGDEMKFFFDSAIDVVHTGVAYISKNSTVKLCTSIGKAMARVDADQEEIVVDVESLSFRLTPHYFKWKYGTDDNFKIKPPGPDVPLFIGDIPASDSLEIKTNLAVDKVVFIRKNDAIEKELPKSNVAGNSYRLSFFFATERFDGSLFAYTSEGKLPLFSLVSAPYIREDYLKLEYDSNVLNYDFSRFFVHDKKDYVLDLNIIVGENKTPIRLEGLDVDGPGKIEVEIFDGEYEIELFYKTCYGGIMGDPVKLQLKDDVKMFGDPMKSMFTEEDTIVIEKFKDPEGKNIKPKDCCITKAKFDRYEGESLVYKGLLSSPGRKRAPIEFLVNDGNTIRKIYFLFGNENKTKRIATFNMLKQTITSDETSENAIPFKSLWIKIR